MEDPSERDIVGVLAELLARAWADQAFKQRLVSAPTTTLKEHGVPLPGGLTIQVISDPEQELTFVLPPAPRSAEHISTSEMSKLPETRQCAEMWCRSLKLRGRLPAGDSPTP